ncbi:maleylpyruvate isomerase N-terminal domain-containing protein [Umezawaea beigongshangensis]|uniref:maleylpyruvate isomerase N-terminal domain-containing protein n=1 Tax=Umezawaea beigongshangensis TaxID=2780383 RepID=UPI0018F18815|nr:maleylpyruvate isomerase N-terminal domain-containing protein [Umezawaea beigongshangensis]
MDFVEQIEIQSAALRGVAVAAGPDAPVPTCPGWTVFALVTHVGRAQTLAGAALRSAPDEPPAPVRESPEDFDELLTWWDERRATLVDRLRDTSPDAVLWGFAGPVDVAWWARRQAHEIAIHRLDGEHAAEHAVAPLLYDPEFAADGVDEYLDLVLRHAAHRAPVEVTGRLLLHAADAERAWEVTLTAGEPPVVGGVSGAATDTDCVVAGTADSVYRAVWRRPSGAVVSGDATLLSALPAP